MQNFSSSASTPKKKLSGVDDWYWYQDEFLKNSSAADDIFI
jgi:hypothetical protein